ncbi:MULTISPECIES: NAD-dependent epimerase/dehydratase family protein [unclassified Spirillospora]|uniref:NAD-dependent epimerase/dehydratase family protein n=1 Tax=unclassified Spirillospora TaxID=2642701 RepID=UPI003714CA60
MHVLIAGASGVIGHRLTALLAAHEHRVTATTTSETKAPALKALGARPVVLDGLDAAAVGEAVAAAAPDVIVHQMTALAGKQDLKHFDRWFDLTNRLRTEGTDHLLTAAQAVGVGQVVAQSYTGWPNARTGEWIKTEDDPLDADPAAAQRKSLEAIQYLEDAVCRAPMAGTVLRYGALYGPGASDAMVDMVRKRRFPIVGDGAGMTSWVHVDDAATATLAAIEQGAGGLFNIVDDEPARVSEWLPHMAGCLGAKPPLRLPRWLGRAAAGEVAVNMMTTARGSSNARAQRELGWRPRWSSWRVGFREALTESAERAAR